MKYYIETYGCVLNKTDSEALIASLESAGWERVTNPEDADIVIINTCSVKEKTVNHMFSRIRKLEGAGNLVVIGCLPSVFKEKIKHPSFGPREYSSLSYFLGVPVRKGAGAKKKRTDRYVASIPIAEGCLGSCTYCAPRIARGPLTSYPLGAVVSEIKDAVEDGRIEIRLTAQDCGVYGKDIGVDLLDLLSRVLELDGEFRVRVGMMTPNSALELVDDGLLDLYADDRVYKFFHLPLQSGSDRILGLMERKYTVSDFVELVRKIRRRFPLATVSTDIIVGFPSESWGEFLDSLRLIGDLEINVLNISRFSPIPGTKAYSFAPKISSNEKKKRSALLHAYHLRVAGRWYRKFLKKKRKVAVVEKGRYEKFIGRTEEYVPVVVTKGYGTLSNVKIVRAYSHFVSGTVVG